MVLLRVNIFFPRLVHVFENQAEQEGPGSMNVPIGRSHGSMREWLRAKGNFKGEIVNCLTAQYTLQRSISFTAFDFPIQTDISLCVMMTPFKFALIIDTSRIFCKILNLT